MLAEEVATYLAGAGLGLVAGVSVFDEAFPAATALPDLSVALVETEPAPSIGSFGDSGSPVDVERPELLVLVRGGRDEKAAARSLAQAVQRSLRRLGPTLLSGVRYLNVETVPPSFRGYDPNGRPVYSFTAEFWKEESPA